MHSINLAFSPCPNDTFIFHAMVHGLIDAGGFHFNPHLADVEQLNRQAFDGTHDITKLSFHAWLLLKDRYRLLRAGAALGHGCGPLVVARDPRITDKLPERTVAIPGTYTTAAMLLRLWMPDITHTVAAPFNEIMEGVRDGIYDAGVIIHEGRFIYGDYGLEKIIDLGAWWEEKTNLPIPLGCIAVREDRATGSFPGIIESAIRASIRYANENREASASYIRSLAQSMDDRVIGEHIALYVNDYSLDLGQTGLDAIRALEEMARCAKVIR